MNWDFSDVKSAPRNNFPSIATVRKGDKLTIMEQSGEWVRARLENGQEGWVRSEILEKSFVSSRGGDLNGNRI